MLESGIIINDFHVFSSSSRVVVADVAAIHIQQWSIFNNNLWAFFHMGNVAVYPIGSLEGELER